MGGQNKLDNINQGKYAVLWLPLSAVRGNRGIITAASSKKDVS
jgi:hypothetical protein